MAQYIFFYRSTRQKAPLTVRLQDHDQNNKKFQFQAKTEFEVSREYWEKQDIKNEKCDAVDKSQIAEVNTEQSEIENFLLSKYKEEKPEPDTKRLAKRNK